MHILRSRRPTSKKQLETTLGSGYAKLISDLIELGYEIKESRSEYRLVSSPEEPYPWEIEANLSSERRLANRILYLEETDSTQDIVAGFANRGEEEGLLVVCRRLNHARGRLGRSFYTYPGGLYFSLLLRPKLRPTECGVITLAAGVALAEAVLTVSNLEPTLKWPNDLLFNGLKFCGVLAEMHSTRGRVDSVVLGVGMNVNFSRNTLPLELRENATTLKEAKGINVSRVELIVEFLKNLERLYMLLERSGRSVIIDEWRRWDKTAGREAAVTEAGVTYSGRVDGIGSEGEIVLQVKGEKMHFHTGDLKLL